MPISNYPDTGGSPKRAGFVLGRRASLAVSVGVAGHTLWTSAAPALTYRLYAQEWHLTYTATTGIFAVYPIAVVAMLVGFGGISDQIGHRAAMLLGLGASLAGAVLFAVAPDVWWVFAGRALTGIGVGLSVGPSSAAIFEFCSDQSAKRAASLTMTAQAGGFAAALLVGGALTEYGPWPTRLCFWVLAVLLAALTIAMWFLPRHRAGAVKGSWRPRTPFVPKDMRRAFATASAAMMAAYTFGVLVLSLGGQVEHDLIGSSNALLNGAVMALFPIVLGPVGIVAKVLSSRIALSIGSVASVLGMGLLAVAVGRRDLLIYFTATATAGAAYSLLFVGGLGLINAAGSPHHRGSVFSALYLVGYLSMGILALVLGAVATTWGLGLAVDLGAAAIAMTSIATLVLAATTLKGESQGPRPISSRTGSHTAVEINMLDLLTNDLAGGAGPDTHSIPEVCVIGAGSSGISVAKALHQRGIAFDCFEKGSDIGGMWRYDNDSGLSSAYASLHIDTSRDNLGYSDFPIPKSMPDFLSHAQFLKYLETYADHFGIRKLVTFRAAAETVRRTPNGRWNVHLSTGEIRTYGKVIVANGHLWDPRTPAFPGEFGGEAIHSHYYRTAAPFEGKSVLVVGLGNSAVDIAVDLARRARSVTMSTRRSAWIMPKYLMGYPVDQWSGFLSRRLHLPTRVTRKIMSRLIRLGVGDQRRFGLKRPEHPMWREHATLSQELLPYLGHGWITIKPDVSRLDGKEIAFEDGSREVFDAIIYATGYKTSFPFLDNSTFNPDTDTKCLYRRMIFMKHPGLIFAGLVQPVGPTIPLVEIQGRWLAAVLSGDIDLPDKNSQRSEIADHQKRQRETYLDSDRYALEVDFRIYSRQLKADMQGAKARV